ncbi:hypothetical protein FBEOM_1250 [Fusarium beomiforme]|uniref:Uncharacterized protein n=1 Tax=Fusarium beomiforme TaxID=44412 RepID=A0A9P5AU67_9HYPO|nr:hypothetical protein FBEOM_1250 [Fusarium beomiforme]
MELYTIPVEIRHAIFERVVTAPNAPANPSESQEGRFPGGNRSTGSMVWKLPPENKALNLLLVCKKFYAEVQDVLAHLPNVYHVDIMFVKNYGLWTTWNIPKIPTSRYIDKVTATMRIFQPTDDLNDRFKRSLCFRGGDGGPEPAVWAFYALLTNLINEGPGDIGSKHIDNRCYIINKVDVNVVAPTDGADHTRLDCNGDRPGIRLRRSQLRCRQDGNESPEERLAGYMTNNLGMVLGASRYTIQYCLPLQEHITDSIVFRVNGKEYKRFNMDYLLQNCDVAEWSYDDSFRERNMTKATRWMKWVLERRERMKKGLELDDNGPETRLF